MAGYDAAIDAAVEAFGKAGLRPDEIALAVKVGIEAVVQSRELCRIRAQEAREEERAVLREEFAQEREKIAKEAREALEAAQDLDSASRGARQEPGTQGEDTGL